ncbi:TetR/AcrR family transcriptional regulator [Actinoplanes sp. NPDC051411]|uniref:TetR/AcrR family transcriptional regulator n=1 Tax=Actinoplanes sp. NPDC051411 TaxID=3155522 RepID=UPI003429D187
MRRDHLYDDLLAAAIQLASSRLSLAIPSLRAVARACDVSATAVYRHFASQSDLNRAVLLAVDSSFVGAVTSADDPGRAPRERLRLLAYAYLGWGLANPGLYQLRFESADQLGDDHVHTDGADMLLAQIGELIRASATASPVTATDLWAGMHGLTSLRVHKPGHRWHEDGPAHIDRLLTAWGLGPTGVS